MSSSSFDATALSSLPAFAALETAPVLVGRKDGASIQMSDLYFENQLSVLRNLDSASFTDRIAALEESYEIVQNASIHLNSLSVGTLEHAANNVHETYRSMPETKRLRSAFPGDCLTVPEFVRTGGNGIDFGLRAYFFREGDAPDAGEIIRRNVVGVVEDTEREFERYQGGLHGYPECCIDAFMDRSPEAPAPEVRSVEALSCIREDRIGARGASITDILPDFFEDPHAYAFFSRKFFPEPGCATAEERGRDVFEGLTTAFPETMVRDSFRLNYALCYTLAHSLTPEGGKLPRVGSLGTEHVYAYLPLKNALSVPRYRSA
ncbi:hypothetical protein ZOD2009_17750 [Haladaptatus paucihalophilus DX253]|uniref:Uncharacterized protein n=1 Tax=Haladaptatus paucihalophilus DX253 TaxID=797209 RepID=E7QXL1_HALPU|nr:MULTISPECIES: hypothetical protein [Haladaptatus]EFW90724.1 hypothetical protein ZOD2009_17750 [Haladaptatus paucihalophilus DX253]GKZ15764.1 hypothetical protein HAL_36450 [Haladaptatus sp. T7]SHL16989.1 hypothetical protein SAMN05444342_3116 [Haladaptatus paucihalophilus DX253]